MTRTEEVNPFQQHYTLGELAKYFHFARRTVANMFRDEPVLRWQTNAKLRKGRKQVHTSVRVPESVARRVYEERTGKKLSSDFFRRSRGNGKDIG